MYKPWSTASARKYMHHTHPTAAPSAHLTSPHHVTAFSPACLWRFVPRMVTVHLLAAPAQASECQGAARTELWTAVQLVTLLARAVAATDAPLILRGWRHFRR